MDLAEAAQRKINPPSAVVTLGGYFVLLCSALALAVTLAEVWRESV
jgi:hypothetical protein